MRSAPPEHVVVSDVDGTLLGDDRSLAEFAEWFTFRRARLGLVLASGRFFASVADSVRASDIPPPDAIVGGVGTEIRWYPGGEPLAGWEAAMAPDWDAEEVRRALAGAPGLELQPAEFLSEWKVSYYAHDASPEALRAVETRLSRAGVRARLVYSSRRDLDVLPARASKGDAVAFLADSLGLAADRVIVCGDSGNDASMFGRGFRGVVVGNAHPELKEHAGQGVYVSVRPFAGGVLEGLRRWLD